MALVTQQLTFMTVTSWEAFCIASIHLLVIAMQI